MASQHQLDYVRSLITPISSEHGLRYYEHDTVENAVQKLVDAVYENPVLRASVGLRGTVTFESHTNLGTIDSSLSEPSESAPPPGPVPGRPRLHRLQRTANAAMLRKGRARAQPGGPVLHLQNIRWRKRPRDSDRVQGATQAEPGRIGDGSGLRDPTEARCDQQGR
jgi:hypothetical protein